MGHFSSPIPMPSRDASQDDYYHISMFTKKQTGLERFVMLIEKNFLPPFTCARRDEGHRIRPERDSSTFLQNAELSGPVLGRFDRLDQIGPRTLKGPRASGVFLYYEV